MPKPAKPMVPTAEELAAAAAAEEHGAPAISEAVPADAAPADLAPVTSAPPAVDPKYDVPPERLWFRCENLVYWNLAGSTIPIVPGTIVNLQQHEVDSLAAQGGKLTPVAPGTKPAPNLNEV